MADFLSFFMSLSFNFFVVVAAASAFFYVPPDDVELDIDSTRRLKLLAASYLLRSFDFGKPYVGIASSRMLYCHPKLREEN